MACNSYLSPLSRQVYELIREHPTGLRAVDIEILLGLPRGDRGLQEALSELRSKEYIIRRTRDTMNRTFFVARRKKDDPSAPLLHRGRRRGRLRAFHEHQPIRTPCSGDPMDYDDLIRAAVNTPDTGKAQVYATLALADRMDRITAMMLCMLTEDDRELLQDITEDER